MLELVPFVLDDMLFITPSVWLLLARIGVLHIRFHMDSVSSFSGFFCCEGKQVTLQCPLGHDRGLFCLPSLQTMHKRSHDAFVAS